MPGLATSCANSAPERRCVAPSSTDAQSQASWSQSKRVPENTGRAVLNGATHTGYPVELHLTELGPGQRPHPPHRHVHEEILMLQTGQLEVTMNGQTTRIRPGSVVYVASNDLHGWMNQGAEPAQYFVIALGGDAA